jgi:hypothetical protein
MQKINDARLLHAITQPAIKDLCQRHDDTFIRMQKEHDKLREEWIINNAELLEQLLNSEVE